MLVLASMLSPTSSANTVEFADAQLETAVRQAVGLGDNEIITAALLKTRLTKLVAHGREIRSLSGLEYATNLRVLNTAQNNITDLTPLRNMRSLEVLWIWDNPIIDVTPLRHLIRLNDIRLSRCRISDIEALSGLVYLTTLYLDGNEIADVRPLKTLIKLRTLYVNGNRVVDHSPLDTLSLTQFVYDQACDMPPLPLEPRLEERSFPSVVAAFGGFHWGGIMNKQHLSPHERFALHDLWFSGLHFGLTFFQSSEGWELRMPGEIAAAVQDRDTLIGLNPNMVFLVKIEMRSEAIETFGADWPYWVRDAEGQIVNSQSPVKGLIDFTHPDIQDRIVSQAAAVSRCGLYDGIIFDWWNESGQVLRGYRSNADEQAARDIILRRIRAVVHPNFLITGNVNRRIIPRTGAFINGASMETGVPGHTSDDELDARLSQIERTLLWSEENLKRPQINHVSGVGYPGDSHDSVRNLRWLRVMTTLTLTHSDGYILYHPEYWYDFWDADLGRPVGAKGQLYQETEGLYIREFTNGWAVYNHSGAPQALTLPEEVQGVASGWVNTEHALPNLDGEMYLRVEVKNPADVNGDGVVNIIDLTIVAQTIGTGGDGGDVNEDGVVNVFDLVMVAEGI